LEKEPRDINKKWLPLNGSKKDADLVKRWFFYKTNFGVIDKENYLVNASTEKIMDALKGIKTICK